MIKQTENPENAIAEIGRANYCGAEAFVQRDRYSMSKARCERYLRQVSSYKNWTIVRPMINTSDKRLDIVQYTFDEPIQYAKAVKVMYIADNVKDKIAH